jgi:hypothetical protein
MIAMFNLSRLFRSRWAALWWAAGILFTAWQVAGTAPSDHEDAGKGEVDSVASLF